MKWVALLMFGGVGLPFLLVGIGWGMKRYALFRAGVSAQGVVVENVLSSSGRSSSYYPTVEFTAKDGAIHRFKGSTGQNTPEYEVGQRLGIVYDPGDPSKAQIADFDQFWLGPLGVGLFGFLFVVAGVGSFLIVQDSDKTFGPAFEQEIARQELVDRGRGIPLQAVVKEIKTRKEGGKTLWVVVCRGGAPGGAERDFESAPLSFDPGTPTVGKKVTVYADPQNPDRYVVLLDPLFPR